MKLILITLILLLFNTGCATKTEYDYLKSDKYEFAVPLEIKAITVNVVDDNVVINKDVYVNYITLLRAKIDNLVSQIEDYTGIK